MYFNRATFELLYREAGLLHVEDLVRVLVDQDQLEPYLRWFILILPMASIN